MRNCYFAVIWPVPQMTVLPCAAFEGRPVLGSKITQISKYRPKNIKVKSDINLSCPRTYMALKIISHDTLDCKSTVSHILVVETIYKTDFFSLL